MRLLNEVVACAVLAIAVGAASFTIARTKITIPLREAINRKSKWLGSLINCPYCVSHYLALAGVIVYRPRPVHLHWLPDTLAAWFFVVAISALTFGQINKAVAPQPTPVTTRRPSP